MRAIVACMVCLASTVGLAGCGRVLVVFPVPGRSHSIVGHSLVDILLGAGHEVTYVTAFPRDGNSTGAGGGGTEGRLRYVDISSVLDQVSGKERINMEYLARNPRPAHAVLQNAAAFNRRALQHAAVQELVRDPSAAFDIVIIEWFFSGLLAPLAAVFECPLVWYSASDVSWQSLRLVHESASPAYSVELSSREVPKLPFTTMERAYQLGMQLYMAGWVYYMTQYVEVPAYKELYTGPMVLRGRTPPPYEQLVFNASLLLVNAHPPLGQSLPLPLNAKYVGGHHVELPTQPLPDNLQNILDNATNGAVFFSMGSNLKSKDFPDRIKRELVTLLGQLPQTILWKFEEQLDNTPSNLHILDWAPQTSILNHPNTVVFITHGGLLSLVEATHFGVPIVGIPLFGDQFVNVELTAARGCGLRVDFTDDLPRNILAGVNQILDNSRYRVNAEQASAIFRRRLATPQQELAHWVQLVLETRGAVHLRSPALLVPTTDRLYLDILILFAAFLWLLSKVVKVIRVHWSSSGDDSEKKDQ